ncbi:MFS general substrate transporter [Obba rivulosa]|uniref:MFS general substrate transporter n=1 Tax=Obba rivulosa TaxID=1052685 RepID=A0A8E2DP74_9APHY|nr:MFS general substrate transporter [Obba rivulosa]
MLPIVASRRSTRRRSFPFAYTFSQNWSRAKRWYMTYVASLLAFNATFASAAPAGIATNLIEQFGLSQELAVLTISLFVAGYCVGPLFWGPLSEQYGRRPIFLVSFPIYTCFQLGCALSRNKASIIIFRLLGGMFAAAPLTNSGALISDIWDAKTRGKAITLFVLAPFIGPALGPLVGGYISDSGVTWRWLFWVLTIFAGCCFGIQLFTLPETYAPILLVQKARQLRRETGDQRYHAPFERSQKLGLAERLRQTLMRPFKILFQEPMLIATTIYMSFMYGTVYLLFEAFPVVFQEGHGFSPGKTGLMYIPLIIGSLLGGVVYLVMFHPRYEAAVEAHKPNLVPPEIRLDMAMTFAPLFAVTFFWFGWTSFPTISFWAPMMAGMTLGLSVICLFLALFNYIIADTYLFAAASALAANTVVRSSAGATFPLFATQMYNALNPRWASTLLGCFACLLLPIPFILKRYGAALRAKSRYAPNVYGL